MRRKYLTLSTKEPVMGQHTLPLGWGNFVILYQVMAVLNPKSAAAKRTREKADSDRHLLDFTHGKKTRSIIVTASNHVILSAVNCDVIQVRMEKLWRDELIEEVDNENLPPQP